MPGGRGHKNYYSGVRLLKIEVVALDNRNGTLGKWNGSPVSFSRRYFAVDVKFLGIRGVVLGVSFFFLQWTKS
jgi:hypothetical protein